MTWRQGKKKAQALDGRTLKQRNKESRERLKKNKWNFEPANHLAMFLRQKRKRQGTKKKKKNIAVSKLIPTRQELSAHWRVRWTKTMQKVM